MKHLLLILLLIASFSSKSQSSIKIDSLKNLLAKYPSKRTTFQSDTMRVRLLCAVAEQFNNPDSSLKYAQQAKTISTERNWIEGMYESGFLHGRGLYHKNLYYQAIDIYFGLLTLCEKNHFRKREAVVLRAIGDVNFRSEKNYPLASKYFKLSMAIFKELKEYEEYADTQNNLATVYINDNKPREAIKLLEDCLTYLPYIKGNWSEISFLENLGIAYNFLKEYDKALYYALQAERKIHKIDDNHNDWKAQTPIIVGFIYQRKGDFKNAIYYANMAKSFLPNDGKGQTDLNKLYYESYKLKKNYAKSLYYFELLKENEDKSSLLEKNRVLESLKSVYDLDKEKDKVILLNATLEKENLLKKIGLIGLAVISLFLIFAYWSFVNQKRKNKQIEAQKLAIEELNNSLEVRVNLRTQELSIANQELTTKNQEISEALFKGQSIERTRVASALHDNLGGSMAAVKWMLESIDTERLSEDDRKVYQNALNITSEAYSDVRFMSHNFIPEVLAQLGLQNAVKKLCQEITQTKKLNIDFEDKTFSEFTHQIELEVYSICLELITNILKHSKATEAKILMQEDESALKIVVTDNGIGMSEQDINGKGLKNISKRLEAIKGILEVKSIVNEKSEFLLTIPLAMKEEYMTQTVVNHANAE